MVAQVQRSSLISSNLAVSRSLGRGRSRPSSSSPLVDPASSGPPRAGRPYGKRSSSSSRSGGRKRFRGGQGSAPSSKPSGFRKWEPSPYLTLSGGCLSLHWQAWRDRGTEPWVVEVLREGYRIPFLGHPPLSPVPIPMPSYNPLSTKGVALEEVTLDLVTKGAVELAPLPSPGFYSPSVCRVEDLGVVASSHRPLHPQSLRGCVALSDGDHPVCSPFCSSGRLDGLHRSSGGVPPGSGSSGVSSLPPLCVQWSSLPIQCAVLWPIHGSTGLLSGHGSCFCHSPLDEYPHAQISRRLAGPVLFSGVPSPGSPDSPD